MPDTTPNNEGASANDLMRAYGIDDMCDALVEARRDAAALRNPLRFLLFSGTIESYAPRRRLRPLRGLAVALAGIVLMGLAFHECASLIGRVHVWPAPGNEPGLAALATLAIVGACYLSAILVAGLIVNRMLRMVQGFFALDADGKRDLAKWLAEYPYRRRIVRDWIAHSDTLLYVDRDALMRLPTQHAAEARAFVRHAQERRDAMRGLREEVRARRATEALRAEDPRL